MQATKKFSAHACLFHKRQGVQNLTKFDIASDAMKGVETIPIVRTGIVFVK